MDCNVSGSRIAPECGVCGQSLARLRSGRVREQLRLRCAPPRWDRVRKQSSSRGMSSPRGMSSWRGMSSRRALMVESCDRPVTDASGRSRARETCRTVSHGNPMPAPAWSSPRRERRATGMAARMRPPFRSPGPTVEASDGSGASVTTARTGLGQAAPRGAPRTPAPAARGPNADRRPAKRPAGPGRTNPGVPPRPAPRASRADYLPGAHPSDVSAGVGLRGGVGGWICSRGAW